MKILALESSAVAASVAVCEDGRLISEAFLNIGLTHSQTLLPSAQNALQAAGLTAEDIDVYAVAAGPGSFTGIRIGVAAVKGMAFVKNKPCYGISTLEAMAALVGIESTCICPVMDARCMQVYTALFRCENQKTERLLPDSAIKVEELGETLQSLQSNIILVGDGAEKYFDTLRQFNPHICLAPPAIRQQKASGVALAAWQYSQNGIAPISSAQLVPCYLRLSQAERERQN